MTSAAHDRAVRGLLAANNQAAEASKAVHALIEDDSAQQRQQSQQQQAQQQAHVQQSRDAAETLVALEGALQSRADEAEALKAQNARLLATLELHAAKLARRDQRIQALDRAAAAAAKGAGRGDDALAAELERDEQHQQHQQHQHQHQHQHCEAEPDLHARVQRLLRHASHDLC